LREYFPKDTLSRWKWVQRYGQSYWA
jgi:hypothetical protein